MSEYETKIKLTKKVKKQLLIIIALLCTIAQGTWAEEITGTWADNGIRATDFSQIDETAKTVTITNEAELALLEYNVSYSGGHTYGGWTFYLDKDLDMSAHYWVAMRGYFWGTFDGQGHTISGLNYPTDNAYDAGLFAANYGTIKNVKLTNSTIIGKEDVGAIAGCNKGTVENCYVSASVSVINNNGQACGGIVGRQELNDLYEVTPEGITSITRGCYSEASVSSSRYVGGIIGHIKKDMKMLDCVSKATINGGAADAKKNIIVGTADEGSILENNFYISETTLDGANGTRLINVSLSSDLTSAKHKLSYGGPVNKTYNVSGITFYYQPQIAVDGKWYAEAGNDFKFNLRAAQDGMTFCYVNIDGNEITPSGYEYTISASDAVAQYVVDAVAWKGSGTEENPYQIQTTADWNSICKVIKTVSADNFFAGKYFKQDGAIEITQGIGVTGNPNDKKFCGIYDGNNNELVCQLTNPVSGSAEAVAPFHNTNGATIKNLYVTGTISGGIRTAGLVAYTHGDVTIDNCRVAADITCTGDQYQNAHGAGLIGYSMDGSLTIKNSLFDGKLKAVSNGRDNLRLASIADGGNGTLDIQYCAENGKYEGTTDNSQTAFCWKNNDNTTPNNDRLNVYFSALGHTDGADKAVPVTSGTDDLEIAFPDTYYNWQEVYQGAMLKSADEYAIAYLIDEQFYAIKSDIIQFDIEYPENWKNVKLYNGSNEISKGSGHYSFRVQSDEDVVITAQHEMTNWIDNGIVATEFSTVDEANKVVTITSPEELALLAKQVQDGTDKGEGWTYNMDVDVDMYKYEWTQIGNSDKYFKGTFDGQGHTISGIKLPDSSKIAVGLFGAVQGTVKNLIFTDSQIQGQRNVGGIVGMLRGTVENCYVGNDVNVMAVAVEGESDSGTNCGGIAGNCGWDTSLLKGNYSAATVSGKKNIGGIVGYVFLGTMEANVSMATVSGNEDYGMVVGYKTSSSWITLRNNYYIADAASTNSNDVRAFNVKMSSDLTSQGFDFTYDGDNTEYDISQVKMYDGQFQLDGEWYVPANGTFKFKLPAASSEYLWLEWTDVKVNDGNAITPSAGVYSFDTTGDTSVEFEINATVIKGSPVTGIDGIEQSDNVQSDDDAIYDLSGRKVSNGQMPKGIYIQNGKVVVKK